MVLREKAVVSPLQMWKGLGFVGLTICCCYVAPVMTMLLAKLSMLLSILAATR